MSTDSLTASSTEPPPRSLAGRFRSGGRSAASRSRPPATGGASPRPGWSSSPAPRWRRVFVCIFSNAGTAYVEGPKKPEGGRREWIVISD